MASVFQTLLWKLPFVQRLLKNSFSPSSNLSIRADIKTSESKAKILAVIATANL
jgi:hypothetical protein